MTQKEKQLVLDLVYYAKAVGLRGHTRVKELLKEAIEKVEPLLKK